MTMTEASLAPGKVQQEAAAVDVAALERDLRRRIDGEVRFDTASRAMYDTDGSNYKQVPIGVVVPRTKQAIIDTIAVCRRHNAPVLNRGGGTSLSGQCCNVAVVIDSSKYLHHILDIDPNNRLARVEPGTILDHLRKLVDKRYQLTFGPDPATHSHCTFGGMIGNNSCGIHSVMAGKTVDNVEELEVLTYDGLRMTVGRTSDEELQRIIGEGGRRGQIYHDLKHLRDRYAELIRRRYPKIPRRVSGYNLDQLLPENGFHVARALVGSEGTCVTVLEATVDLVYSPKCRGLTLLGYPDVYSAADHVMRIMEFGPVGLEGIDHHLVDYMKQKGLHTEDLDLLPEGKGWLLVEFGGDTEEEADEKARRMIEALAKEKNPPTSRIYLDEMEESHVWEVRESGLGATANVPGEPLMWPGWEDAAVPPEKLGGYLRDFRALLDKYGYEASLYGHFGQGCVHCRIPFDLMSREGVDRYMHFVDEASDLVNHYGGSFTGEHGDGQSKAFFLPKIYGPELMAAFRQFKTIWDPDWKMNPGKVIRAFRPDENLRLGRDYSPWRPDTHFRFPHDDGSMARATLRCVGVGKCRRTHDAFMCPSYQVTMEEQHTTRGRARLLFEMFQGDLIKDGWNSEAVKETLELCLGCKGCKTECPVNVDIAKYKAEFLSHYYETHARPRAAYSMGLIGFWSEWGRKVPWIANLTSSLPGVQRLAKLAAGVSQHRQLPRFAKQSFMQWFRQREPRNLNGTPVVVYPDVFNDSFDPGVLSAIVLVLERFGHRVTVPEPRPPALRPLVHFGFLKQFKERVHGILRQFDPYILADTPIIAAEPSTASVFRDELKELLPDDPKACRLSEQVLLLTEFMQKQKLEPPAFAGKVVLHEHCHQKSVLNAHATREILGRMGMEIEVPEPGCCGMAGAFGMEADKYEISMQIAEQNLLPAVRKASKDTFVVADGFSCRTQIAEGSERHALHMAELLLLAFEKNDRLNPAGPTGPKA